MARLEEICSLITDGSHFSPEDEGVGYPMFSVKDMTPNGFNISGCKKIGEEAYKKLVANGCKPLNDDVVVAKDGSYLKTAFVIKGNPEITLLSSIAILRPKIDLVVPEYLSYFLKSDAVYRTVSLNYITGTALKRIILKGIRKIEVDLPDIGEQEQRAQRLSKVDYLCQLRKQQLAKLDELVKARFVEMFGERSSIRPQKLKEVTRRVKVGFVGTCEKYYTDNTGVPMLRTTNITSHGIDLKDLKYVTRTFHEKNLKSRVHKGDLLIARHGSNGQANVYCGDEAQCLNAIIIEPNHNITNPIFLENLINSRSVKRQIEKELVGSTQHVLNTTTLANVEVKIPAIKEQQVFAAFVERVNQQKQTVQQSLEKLELMKKALMQEYFG